MGETADMHTLPPLLAPTESSSSPGKKPESVGVTQECRSPQRPELRVLLRGALEVYHEDDVTVSSRRVLVAWALERTVRAEHLALHLHLP